MRARVTVGVISVGGDMGCARRPGAHPLSTMVAASLNSRSYAAMSQAGSKSQSSLMAVSRHYAY